MRKRLILPVFFTILIILGVLFTGCVNSPEVTPSPIPPVSHPMTPAITTVAEVSTSMEARSVVDANNQFAFDLYKKLKDEPANAEKNIFFSPFGISSAMAITSEGARGKTVDEIQAVFHFPKDTTTMRKESSEIIGSLGSDGDSSAVYIANALWAEKTYQFLPEYSQTADQYYHAGTTNLEIQNDPDGAVATVNRWVKEKTKGRISDLVSRDDIDPDATRLLITNAIYFSGTWENQFPKDRTRSDTFRISPNKTVNAMMMTREDGDMMFRYTELPDMQVLELPYTKTGSRELSMLVLLPKKDLPAMEKSLTAQDLSRIRQSIEFRKLTLIWFPRFSLKTRYDLSGTLGSMGMPTAFTQDADLSGMDGLHKNLYIDGIIHRADVDVNEEGTVAAAATVVRVKSQGGSDGLFFIADHPFIFIIQDRENGNILFMGRVMNPNG